MSVIGAVLIYVADKMVSQFIKDEGYGRLRKWLFPEQKYKERLCVVIQEAVDEFEILYPISTNTMVLPFYHSQILFDQLNQQILFKNAPSTLSADEFKKNAKVLIPTGKQLEDFYRIFLQKVQQAPTLRRLYFNEFYQSEIFNISRILDETKVNTEKIISDIDSLSSSMNSQMNQLRNQFRGTFEIKENIKLNGLALQPKIEKLSERNELVNEMLNLMSVGACVWLHGHISMGKTQLAVLIAERFANAYWISLAGTQSGGLLNIIENEIANHFANSDGIIETLQNNLEKLPKGSLLVLDDLPKISMPSRELQMLKELLEKLRALGVSMLITSNFKASRELTEYISDDLLLEKSIPYLTKEETKEVLITYGATEAKSEALKKIVCDTSYGHPAIVTAVSRYLKSLDWVVNENTLAEIFTGDFTTDLQDNTYDKIFRTVADTESKKLLYRLKVVIGTISSEQLSVISMVRPSIDFPNEKILNLIGLWVQRGKNNSYELSPLIKHINSNNLSDKLYQTINKALAKHILSKKVLDPVMAREAILYFVNAKSYNDAGYVLSNVLQELITRAEISCDWQFSKMWISVKLPDEMDLFLKSVIRYLQINICIKKGEVNLDFLLSDLEELVLQATRKNINVAHAALLLATRLSDKDQQKSSQFLILALAQLEQIKQSDTTSTFPTHLFAVESLIWKNLLLVTNAEEFRKWFDSYKSLTDAQQISSLNSEMHEVCVLIFCNRLFESITTDDKCVWKELVDFFDHVLITVGSLPVGILIACCVKIQIRIYCAKLHEVEKAVQLSINYEGLANSEPKNKFLLSDELGRQFFYLNQNDRATPFLLEAASIDVSTLYTEKLDTYLSLNQILGSSNKSYAHQFAEKAYLFQNGNQFIDDVFSAKAIGEYAISKWETQQSNEVFNIMEEGLEKILSSYSPIAEYQGTIIRYGHVLNYYYHKAQQKVLPEIDNQPYTPPFRGIFAKNNERLVSNGYYFEQRKFMAAFLMVQIFEYLDDKVRAEKWITKCFRLSNEVEINPFAILMTGMNGHLIIREQYEDALYQHSELLRQVTEQSNEKDLDEKISPWLNKIAGKLNSNPKVYNNDDVLMEFSLTFIVMKCLSNYKDKPSVYESLNRLRPLESYFSDKQALNTVLTSLAELADDAKTDADIVKTAVADQTMAPEIKVIIYLIASMKSDAKQALGLHLAVIERLVVNSAGMSSKTPFVFIVTPFFIDFWKKKISENQSYFIDIEYLQNEGLTLVEKSASSLKLKKLFKFLCYHLEVSDSAFSEWFESKAF